MKQYRTLWAYENSAKYLPQALRALSDNSWEEMLSADPIRESQLFSVSANLLEKYPSLAIETN